MRQGVPSQPALESTAQPWPRRLPLWLPALAIFLAITLPHLNQGDFRTDTAWYSAIGVQAWRADTWPHFWSPLAEPGTPYFNKPPLVLWIHGLLLWLLGVELWVARIGSVIAGAITVALTVRLARVGASPLAAASAGCVLALTYEFFRRTKEVSLDLWHAAFLTAALVCIATAVLGGSPRQRPHHRAPAWWALAGAMVGLALLCKPLQALLTLPVAAIWALIVSPPALRARTLGHAALALLAALLVAAPWHLSMLNLHGDEFTRRYFQGEIGERLAGAMAQFDVETQRPTFYLEQLARTYWPWFAMVVASVWILLRERRSSASAAQPHQPPPPHAQDTKLWPLVLLAILWTSAWLAALSIFPDRRDRYALVLWPALAVIAAALIDTRRFSLDRDGRTREALSRLLRKAPILATAAGIVFALLPVRVQRGVDPQWPALFAFLRNPDYLGRTIRAGGIHGNMSARLYLELGRWPEIVRDPDRLAPGELLLYHIKGHNGPGPGETTLFKERDLWLTRLDEPPWRPLPREQAWK